MNKQEQRKRLKGYLEGLASRLLDIEAEMEGLPIKDGYASVTPRRQDTIVRYPDRSMMVNFEDKEGNRYELAIRMKK